MHAVKIESMHAWTASARSKKGSKATGLDMCDLSQIYGASSMPSALSGLGVVCKFVSRVGGKCKYEARDVFLSPCT